MRFEILAQAHSNAWRSPAHFDHHRLGNGCFGSQTIHNPGEDTFVTPPLPSVVEGFRRAVFLRRSASAQHIAIDEDYAAQHTPVINARLTVALGKEGLQTGHLRVAQPEKVAHNPVSMQSLNQAASARSMGPDPTDSSGDLFTNFYVSSALGSGIIASG